LKAFKADRTAARSLDQRIPRLENAFRPRPVVSLLARKRRLRADVAQMRRRLAKTVTSVDYSAIRRIYCISQQSSSVFAFIAEASQVQFAHQASPSLLSGM
jgi:hypothetical protein